MTTTPGALNISTTSRLNIISSIRRKNSGIRDLFPATVLPGYNTSKPISRGNEMRMNPMKKIASRVVFIRVSCYLYLTPHPDNSLRGFAGGQGMKRQIILGVAFGCVLISFLLHSCSNTDNTSTPLSSSVRESAGPNDRSFYLDLWHVEINTEIGNIDVTSLRSCSFILNVLGFL